MLSDCVNQQAHQLFCFLIFTASLLLPLSAVSSESYMFVCVLMVIFNESVSTPLSLYYAAFVFVA